MADFKIRHVDLIMVHLLPQSLEAWDWFDEHLLCLSENRISGGMQVIAPAIDEIIEAFTKDGLTFDWN